MKKYLFGFMTVFLSLSNVHAEEEKPKDFELSCLSAEGYYGTLKVKGHKDVVTIQADQGYANELAKQMTLSSDLLKLSVKLPRKACKVATEGEKKSLKCEAQDTKLEFRVLTEREPTKVESREFKLSVMPAEVTEDRPVVKPTDVATKVEVEYMPPNTDDIIDAVVEKVYDKPNLDKCTWK